MSSPTEKESKTERIELRVNANAKALLTAAAQARHTSVSEFLLTHGLQAAEQVVAMPRVIFASEEGWATVQRMLDDAENHIPSERTVAWIAGRSGKT